jgi:hypothetical protein
MHAEVFLKGNLQGFKPEPPGKDNDFPGIGIALCLLAESQKIP